MTIGIQPVNGLSLSLALLILVSIAAPTAARERLDNPFVGAAGYIDPDYVSSIQRSMSRVDAATREKMRVVAAQPTAVWLDSIAAIDGSKGRRQTLQQHLQNAVLQAETSTQPVLLLLVIYNLPDRDCSAKASNGTLRGSRGLQRYKTDYIDRIAGSLRDPRFADLRIVTILEPDSLPNLVTNQSVPACLAAFKNKTYTTAIGYALQQFATIDNVYSYLDIGHSGWLGWEDNLNGAVQLYTDVIKQAGIAHVHGVATNTSGYTPVEEPFLPDAELLIGDKPIRSAKFYQWNATLDERDYAQRLSTRFRAAGLPEHFGVLIDTSRNGWGGPDRPTGAQWNASVDRYVNRARVDRRAARNGWCNQAQAGIGERPQPNPYKDAVVHAFVWIKPPGESDGTSDSSQTEPDAEGKSFDADCDPAASNASGYATGAMDGAPAAGKWFHQHFETLVRNAHPALLD